MDIRKIIEDEVDKLDFTNWWNKIAMEYEDIEVTDNNIIENIIENEQQRNILKSYYIYENSYEIRNRVLDNIKDIILDCSIRDIEQMISESMSINMDIMIDEYKRNLSKEKVIIIQKYQDGMFRDYKGTTLNLSEFDTSNVTDMGFMFENCKSLIKLDLSSLDTSNVEKIQYMFCNCKSLKELDLSSFDTSKAKNMKGMFYNCYNLQELDLSNFDTSKVKYMYGIFYGCVSLQELNLSNFNTSNVEDMYGMFEGCKSLTELDLSSFNTSNVKTMREMFFNCNSLKTLDISNFNTNSVENMDDMFKNCKSLETVITNDERIIEQLRKDLGKEHFERLEIINPNDLIREDMVSKEDTEMYEID